MKAKLKILIVDDSAFMRLLLSDLISADQTMEVVGTASNGLEAYESVGELKPDVVVLDLNMHEYDGLYAVKAIMKDRPTPILVVSSVGNTDLQPIFEALNHGAVDYMNKPNRNQSKMREVGDELIQKVRSVSRAKPKVIAKKSTPSSTISPAKGKKEDYEIIAIGASTGGPSAIEQILTGLPRDFSIPIIICQHMPKSFIPSFVERLNSISKIQVVTALKGMTLQAGTVLFCPGHANLILENKNNTVRVNFTDRTYPEYNHPSINAMMQSVAEVYGHRAVGIILTGMGKDGVEGMQALYNQGAYTIAQNRASSVIYGMPKAAVEAGLIREELDIKEIASYMIKSF